MANISTYLTKIKQAVYGEEVRGFIHDALSAMNTESSSAMEFASTAKDSAANSAKAAKTSETNASASKESEEKAKTSETKADGYAKAAKASETQAALSSAAAETAKTISQESAESAKQYSGNVPIVQNGTWWTWNAESHSYQNTGSKAVLNFDKVYPSVDEMEGDKDNQPEKTLAIISSGSEDEDNAKLYIRTETEWQYLVKLSGFTGPKGDKGDTGDAGVGIQSWAKTDGNGAPGTSDTYTFELTNGQSFSYQVYNGADGEGAGDMTAAVYDKKGKNTDVFDYIDNAVKNVQSELTFDEMPTVSSQNPVHSGGIYDALQKKADRPCGWKTATTKSTRCCRNAI